MRLSFVYPSAGDETGGVMALYAMANALSDRGHDVTFVHGPAWETRVDTVDDLPGICFESGVRNLVVDSLDDPALPESDVVFSSDAPRRLGLPCVVVQGWGMLPKEWEEGAMRTPAPKVCVARWLIDLGVELGVPRSHFAHAPCGIDHEIFRPPVPPAERPIDLAVLFNPHPEKGWPVMLDAIERLCEQRGPVNGVVFGRDRPAAALPGSFRFLDAPDHARLAGEVYGQAKVFAQASHREGFGLTAIEAMACGAALVTTDNGGAGDYAEDGVTARVVPVGDAEQLATAIGALLDAPEDRDRLATAGVERARTFTWARCAESIDDILQRYLAAPQEFGQPSLT